MKAERALAAVACVVILAAAGAAAVVAFDRGLSSDEAEYLHAGFLMHEGQRVYRDFFEHHAPFLFQMLAALVPEAEPGEPPLTRLRAYATRARAMTALIGLGAFVAAAWLAWRAGGWHGAAVPTLASLAGAWQTWEWIIADVRIDGASLLLFWSGAALLLGSWRDEKRAAIASGIGIGLAVASAAFNPKWPLACLVLGMVFLINLWRLRRLALYAIVPALAVVAATAGALLASTSLRDYIDFTFDFSIRLGRWYGADQKIRQVFAVSSWSWCPAFFKGVYPFLSGAVVAAFLLVRPLRDRLDAPRRRQLAATGGIAVATLLELRFLHPWPNVGLQYFLMWCTAVAVLHGAAASLLRELLPGPFRPRIGVAALLLILGGFSYSVSDRLTPIPREQEWAAARYVYAHLRPGDTIWISGTAHPVLWRDASYYWFGYADIIRSVDQAQKRGDAPAYLPPAAQSELPPCRIARGLDPHVRFVTGRPDSQWLPEVDRCVAALLESGRAVRPPLPLRGFIRIVR